MDKGLGWVGTPKFSRGSERCGHPHRQLVILENQQPGNRSLPTPLPTVRGAPRADISSSGNEETGLARVWEGRGGERYLKGQDAGTGGASGSRGQGGASLAHCHYSSSFDDSSPLTPNLRFGSPSQKPRGIEIRAPENPEDGRLVELGG